MSAAQIGMLVTMLVYLLGMILTGFMFKDTNKTVGDFYLGGRKLGPLVTAMSAEASDMSSYLLMGLPGLAYFSGMAEVSWTILGLSLGTYFNWLITAKRLRRYTEKINAITVPSFFSKRYDDKKNFLMCIAAVEIVLFFIPYTASGFAACGKLFSSLFNVNYYLAMLISALVIIAYTSLGGFLAASTTDFIQSIIMTIALVTILIFGVNVAGGMDQVLANAKTMSGYFSLNRSYNIATASSSSFDVIAIISTMAWGLGYFGMPHILLRFMAIEDDRKLSISRRVASIWAFLSMLISLLIGMVGLKMSHIGEIPSLDESASETVIIEISKLLSNHGFLAVIVAGVVLSGILASTMSTADSQLLAASSSISSDILSHTFGIKLDDKKQMLVSRLVLLVIAVLGVFLAWNPNSSVFGIVSFAWAGFGASFGPAMILALYWKRSNKFGALAGMVSGGIMIFVWKFLVRSLGGAWDIYELLPAFIVALLFDIVVSLLTEAPEKDVTEKFEEVASMK